jgi:hypothetical protein
MLRVLLDHHPTDKVSPRQFPRCRGAGPYGLSPGGSVVEIALEFRATLDYRPRPFLQLAPRMLGALGGGADKARLGLGSKK